MLSLLQSVKYKTCHVLAVILKGPQVATPLTKQDIHSPVMGLEYMFVGQGEQEEA